MIRRLAVMLLLALPALAMAQPIVDQYGAVIRSDTSVSSVYLCFTGHDFHEGFQHVLGVLDRYGVQGSFFLTGDFVRAHKKLVKQMVEHNHYVGAHSDRHLLYCDWTVRDSLLQTPGEIRTDIQDNLDALTSMGIHPQYFMPPYEWYNQTVVNIAGELGQTTLNFTPGTRANADYTTPEMPNYVPSEAILASIYTYERSYGMNGFHLLMHPGTNPKRKDKLYDHFADILDYLQSKGYRFSRF